MMGFPRTILLAVLALAGNAASLFAQEPLPAPPPTAAETQPSCYAQFERGKPHKVVDAVGWVFGIPKKVILWDRRAVNHRVSLETEQNLAQYLEANGLSSTKVRVNQYDPVGEWRRLRANKEVGAGWRYTIGAFDTLTYTLLPGRLFGSDGYNPYTDSVYIYSDIPCLAQEQASCAKLIRSRSHPGTYAAATSLPIVQLWPEKQTKNDVLDYTLANGTAAQHQEATRIFYAEFGAEVGGQASVLLGSNIPLTLAGAGIGHVTARYKTSTAPDVPPAAGDANLTADQCTAAAPSELRR